MFRFSSARNALEKKSAAPFGLCWILVTSHRAVCPWGRGGRSAQPVPALGQHGPWSSIQPGAQCPVLPGVARMRPEGLPPPSSCVVEPHRTSLTSELWGLKDLAFSCRYQPPGTCGGTGGGCSRTGMEPGTILIPVWDGRTYTRPGGLTLLPRGDLGRIFMPPSAHEAIFRLEQTEIGRHGWHQYFNSEDIYMGMLQQGGGQEWGQKGYFVQEAWAKAFSGHHGHLTSRDTSWLLPIPTPAEVLPELGVVVFPFRQNITVKSPSCSEFCWLRVRSKTGSSLSWVV